MQTVFRRLAVASAGLSLIFYCSCERHKPDELHHGGGEHAQGADEHGHKADAHKADQTHAPSASPTPANFFPTATPH